MFRTSVWMYILCKIVNDKPTYNVQIVSYECYCKCIHKRNTNTKIHENLTTNVLIFIYLIFFYSQLISLLSLLGVILGITPKAEIITRGGVSAVAQGLTHLG